MGELKVKYTMVNYSTAEKKVQNYISDSRKDIVPLMRNRQTMAAAITGGTVGVITFVVPSIDNFPALATKGLMLAFGIAAMEFSDRHHAKLLHDKKNMISAAEHMLVFVDTHSNQNKVVMPLNMEDGLAIDIQKLGLPRYRRSRDKSRIWFRSGFASVVAAAAFYMASELPEDSQISKKIQEIFSQPALPPERKEQDSILKICPAPKAI